MTKSRRDFLKDLGKIAGGVALVSLAGPFSQIAKAEEKTAEEEQEDFKWEEREKPCDLIEEINDPSIERPYRAFKYKADYRAHISELSFEINTEDLTVRNIVFVDGCDGSTTGVANMADGKDADFIISRLKGLQCNAIKSGSSCPDQLANALEQAVKIIKGTACTHCFFAGNFNSAKCSNLDNFKRA
ncbi:MAG: TSCPD domain-containing protein [Bacillota bacterium]|nr:TSCPD domain-containing protein [Bacillota bacterium]